MRKAYYYKFLVSKEDEDQARARNMLHQVTRSLVEIRDLYPHPPADPNNPWVIKKSLAGSEIYTGRLLLGHQQMFDHVIRYWTMDLAKYVVMGNRYFLTVMDHTDPGNPRRYRGEYMYVERGPNDCYIVGWMDLARNRHCSAGDEIGLFWDGRVSALNFKLFYRAA